MLKSPSQCGDSDPATSAVGEVVTESENAGNSALEANQCDVMDLDEISDVENENETMVKSEPVDNDLLLDDELRLQIEKNIEMVVNECSLIESLVEEVTAEANANTEMPVLDAPQNHIERMENVTVTSSSCVKDIVDLPPKIRNDITVIPLNRSSNIKSEPRDGMDIEKRKLSNTTTSIHDTSYSYLAKHSSLTILPVTTVQTKTSIVPTKNCTKNRNNCVEFSLTPDVTIKTVMASSTAPSGASNKVNSTGQNCTPMCAPKVCTSVDQNVGVGTSRNAFAPNPFNIPGPQPICYDSAMKHIVDSLPSSVPCSTFNSANSCLYSKANVSSTLPSCSYSSTYPKCSQVQNTELIPYQQNPSFCNFNSFNQPVSPLPSSKHLKAPNALNPCRMSSSPVPTFIRPKEYTSSPLLCNIISESLANMVPPESPSYKVTPPWTPSSFRSPTSPASLNFPIPSSQNNSNFCPPYNHSNSVMVPVSQTKQGTQNFNYRPNYTPFTPNPSIQRAQCCFSSQIQCFNAACASSSQQQFSIVQHSTRLSNLKSNSMDGVSSLLQYHTYFKKY